MCPPAFLVSSPCDFLEKSIKARSGRLIGSDGVCLQMKRSALPGRWQGACRYMGACMEAEARYGASWGRIKKAGYNEDGFLRGE